MPGSGSDDGITLTALSACLSEGFYVIRVTAYTHFVYTVNWYEGLGRVAPQPRGPPAVYSLRAAPLQYTTGYGSGLLTSTPACSGDGLTAPWPGGGTCPYIHKYWKTFTHCERLPYISGHFDGNVLTHVDI